MTKRRDPQSIEDAVLRCVDALGDDECGRIVGRSGRLVRAWSDPDDDRRIPSWAMLALDRGMRAAGHGQPIHDAYTAQLNEAPSASAGGCPMKAFLDIAEKIGPLASTVSNAVSDGRIDLQERREITEAAHDLMSQVRHLLDTIEVPKPAAVELPHNGTVR